MFCFILYSWYGGKHAVFASPEQINKNGRNYNKRPIWKQTNPKNITRFKRWSCYQFLTAIWNVRYFSKLGQSLSNKNEATHSYWKKKFFRYFHNQINYTDWPCIQIILLGNKNLARCKSLLKNRNEIMFRINN